MTSNRGGRFLSDLTRGTNYEPELMVLYHGAFMRSYLGNVHRAAIQKSMGEQDELGNSWEPLKASTKAYSRPDLRQGLSLGPNKYRPTLTAGQDKSWRIAFSKAIKGQKPTTVIGRIGRAFKLVLSRKFGELLHSMSEEEAKEHAAKIAWAYVKKKYGAKTLMDLLGNADAPILNRTGALLEALAPTEGEGRYVPSRNQLYRESGRNQTFGITLPYADHVHKTRRMWPKDSSAWLREANLAGLKAVEAAILNT